LIFQLPVEKHPSISSKEAWGVLGMKFYHRGAD
jgi:hypothetical protein